LKDQYDYIIVGAGSSGCALANRLSADQNNNVLLVESGPGDRNPFIRMPRGVGLILNEGSKVVWSYNAQTGANRPPERWTKGKVVGGSSSVNGMVYVRGAPLDYDTWEALGCEGWGWSSIEPKFVEIEDHELGAGESRGAGGPLKISLHPPGNPLFEAIVAAVEQMGVKRVDDVNDPVAVRDGGIGYQPATTWKGQRFSAARAFLDPVRYRSNLDIVNETDVLKIEFLGNRAVSVRLRHKGNVRLIGARREIILCAGAIETPKLLQLSGIGPAQLLKSHGIDVVVDAPEVGRNLREHRHFDVQFKVRGESQNTELSGWRALRSVLRYFLMKQGPMTHAAHEVGGFVKSEPGLDHADMQFGLISVSTSAAVSDGKVMLDAFPGITFLGYFTRPTSQGEIRIQSSDPDAPPFINANHLDTEEDCRKAVSVIRWLRKLAQQPALKDWIVEETSPAASAQSDEEILAKALDMGGICFHICGTARMGADAASVVDPKLRVRGVEGLRVADTSIMPTIVSGNTNAPAMIVGLRAADFILEARGA
jgi:choline dehydrogenase-like flavoprotein